MQSNRHVQIDDVDTHLVPVIETHALVGVVSSTTPNYYTTTLELLSNRRPDDVDRRNREQGAHSRPIELYRKY